MAAEILLEIIQDIRRTEGIPVILGGDFNERLDNNVLAALKDAPNLFSLTLDDASGDAISYVGNNHCSLIDHIIVSKDVALGEISGDDAAIVRLDQSVRNFVEDISDHTPVICRLLLQQESTSIDDEITIPIPRNARNIRILFES